MSRIYPLLFEPIFKERIWGSRNLASLLDKDLPAGAEIGESWELVDLPSDESVVANGAEKGASLHDLLDRWGADLLGGAQPAGGRFPLLIKFLDAKDVLSVQVHPDSEAAAALGPDVRPKYEAWYIIHAEPGAVIYCGLKAGVTVDDLAAASRDGTVGDLLNRYQVEPGQMYYLPAGTVHAIGAGLVIAEPQTPSDVTYRLFDWNRVDPKTGTGRELHLDKGLQVTRPQYGTDDFVLPPETLAGFGDARGVRLTACEAFLADRFDLATGGEMPIADDRMAVWMMLAGKGRFVGGDEYDVSVSRGNTVLLPAALPHGVFRAEQDCTWLRVSVP